MIDATDTHYLECTEYKQDASDCVEYYLLRTVAKDSGVMKVIKLTPSAAMSRHRFKVALLNEGIFYSASPTQHNENMRRLFANSLHAV